MKKRLLTSVNSSDTYAMNYFLLILCVYMAVLNVISMGNPPAAMKPEVSGAFSGFEGWFQLRIRAGRGG